MKQLFKQKNKETEAQTDALWSEFEKAISDSFLSGNRFINHQHSLAASLNRVLATSHRATLSSAHSNRR
ncbi:MAG: hypothetical protein ACWIPH_05825 [Ostreibacterium sp.]